MTTKRMSEERLAEIRNIQKPMWMFCEARGLSDTVSELLDHIDALLAELAARTVEDGEVQRHVKWLLTGCVDWDGSRMVDGEIPKGEIKCGDFRQIADLLTRLSAAKAEAERLLQVEREAMDLQANLLKGAEAKADTAERERDEARAALAQARADALEEAAKECLHLRSFRKTSRTQYALEEAAARIRALKTTPTQESETP